MTIVAEKLKSIHYQQLTQLITDLDTDINNMSAHIESINIPPYTEGQIVKVLEHQRNLLQKISIQAEELEKENRENLIDSLTGLYLKKHLISMITNTLTNSSDKRKNGPGCLIMLDVNRMHGLNATYGHIETDMILRQLTQITSAYLRKNDHGFRFGGDEFVLYLDGVDAQTAAELVIKKILLHLSQNPIKAVKLSEPEQTDIKISFCIGAAEFPLETPINPEEIQNVISLTLSTADRLEIEAKDASKSNHTVIAYLDKEGNTVIKTEDEIMSS
jgi:diguanylate cyclase (GGDEF)-like protein